MAVTPIHVQRERDLKKKLARSATISRLLHKIMHALQLSWNWKSARDLEISRKTVVCCSRRPRAQSQKKMISRRW